MNKPLSLVLIEELFNSMEQAGTQSNIIGLGNMAMGTLKTIVINCETDFITFPEGDISGVADMEELKFTANGMTLTFVEKK